MSLKGEMDSALELIGGQNQTISNLRGQLEAWHSSATGGDRSCAVSYANSVERLSAIETEIKALNAKLKRLDRSLGDSVTTQYFRDGLAAAIEGVARTTAKYLDKLEQRIPAIERQHKPHQNAPPAIGSQLASMTGFTRLIQGF